MLAIIGTTVPAIDCVRCGSGFFRTSAIPAVGYHSDTHSPLGPNGALTQPDDPAFSIGALCQRCDTIVTILAPEIGIHTDDLVTFFKVYFPLGRYDLIKTATTDSQPAHDPEDDELPLPDLPPHQSALRDPGHDDAMVPATPEHQHFYENGTCIFC